MQTPIWIWLVFNLFVVCMLGLDLGIMQRRRRAVKVKEALIMTAFWVALAMAFNVLILFWRGKEDAMMFLTGYLVEESLSVDNLFVFLLLFSYFKVPDQYRHQVLFWGILGAIVMRMTFILAGITLINKFHFFIYILGAFLVYSGIKLLFKKDEEIDPERNPVLKMLRRFLPITPEYHGHRFTVKLKGKRFFTPLLVVLITVEVTDIVFAVDSIPAILGITLDPFIVYSSNIFAILGLRAIFFALSGIMKSFHYLSYGLSLVLAFIGVKMLIAKWVHMPVSVALGTVAVLLVGSVVLSLLFPPKSNETTAE